MSLWDYLKKCIYLPQEKKKNQNLKRQSLFLHLFCSSYIFVPQLINDASFTEIKNICKLQHKEQTGYTKERQKHHFFLATFIKRGHFVVSLCLTLQSKHSLDEQRSMDGFLFVCFLKINQSHC